MTINVLMPVFATPVEWVKEAVESIIAQTYDDHNFIIVDDNNPRGSLTDYLYSLTDRCHCINIVRTKENKGIAAALDYGLLFCHGDLIVRMDADDIARPHLLQRHNEYFMAHRDRHICGVQIHLFNDHTEWFSNHPSVITRERAFAMPGHWFVNHPGIAFRGNAISRVRGYGGREESFSSEPSLNADPWGDEEGGLEDFQGTPFSHSSDDWPGRMNFGPPDGGLNSGADSDELSRQLPRRPGGEITPRAAMLDQRGPEDDGFFGSGSSREDSGLGPAARGPPARLGIGEATPPAWDHQHDSDAGSDNGSSDIWRDPAAYGRPFSDSDGEQPAVFRGNSDDEPLAVREIRSKFPALQLLRAVDRTIGLIKKT